MLVEGFEHLLEAEGERVCGGLESWPTRLTLVDVHEDGWRIRGNGVDNVKLLRHLPCWERLFVLKTRFESVYGSGELMETLAELVKAAQLVLCYRHCCSCC